MVMRVKGLRIRKALYVLKAVFLVDGVVSDYTIGVRSGALGTAGEDSGVAMSCFIASTV